MNHNMKDNTRAMSAFFAVDTLEKLRGEGVTVAEVAAALGISEQTSRTWLQYALMSGLVARAKRHVMGAAWKYVYYGMFSASFEKLYIEPKRKMKITGDQIVLFKHGRDV